MTRVESKKLIKIIIIIIIIIIELYSTRVKHIDYVEYEEAKCAPLTKTQTYHLNTHTTYYKSNLGKAVTSLQPDFVKTFTLVDHINKSLSGRRCGKFFQGLDGLQRRCSFFFKELHVVCETVCERRVPIQWSAPLLTFHSLASGSNLNLTTQWISIQ